ncbi:unnamed protein product [Ectocarpus sp. 12 AP-2014]
MLAHVTVLDQIQRSVACTQAFSFFGSIGRAYRICPGGEALPLEMVECTHLPTNTNRSLTGSTLGVFPTIDLRPPHLDRKIRCFTVFIPCRERCRYSCTYFGDGS